MANRVVRYTEVVSLGIDHHEGLYYVNLANGSLAPFAPPYIPVPATLIGNLHGVLVPIDWSSLKDGGKMNTSVFADNEWIVSADHTALHTVHLPLGVNVLLPVVIYMGECSWKFGVNSVQATKGAVASTLVAIGGLTFNCADPVSMPCGAFLSQGTVHVNTTLGDILSVAVDWLISETVNLLTQAGLKAVGKKVVGKYGEKVAKGAVGDLLAKLAKHSNRTPRVKALADVVVKNVVTGSQKKVEKAFGDGGRWVFDKHEEAVYGKDAARKSWQAAGDNTQNAVKGWGSGEK